MNLSSRLSQTVKEYGDKPAFIFEGTETSYSQLEGEINKFANRLRELGIKKGDHVAIILGNSPYFVISLYGALKVGATIIPVNPIYTPYEIAYIINNGDVKAVVTLDLLIPLLENLHERIQMIEHIIVCETPLSENKEELDITKLSIFHKMVSFTKLLSTSSSQFDGPVLEDEDVAVILYTSGTTGKPKGAMLTHKNLYSNAIDTANYLKISKNDVIVTALPMFHVFCLTVALNAPLMNGATLLIVPRFSPQVITHLIKTYHATLFAGVPTMYNFLLQYENASQEDVQTLRLCISGGASMPVALLKGFEQKYKVIVSEGYGLSEASPVTCFNPLDRPRKPGSIGTSIINVENKVVNELGEECQPNQVGELIVKGPNVMKGYYKMPEETAYTIRDGWLYTGDLARQDEEGYFYIVDRKKDMIIVGGYNVYPREVEEVIYSHRDVVEVAVLGVPDSNLGEAVKCFVVVKNNELTEELLIEYCKEHLAKYKVPGSIEFLEELPKNTTGKILRRALKQQILQK
ncbi:fatty acid--CoA ligase family protein [Metabacillus sediminilitoris]|uniref:Fatty acid--CoA ligase family protein n=1 Tax=Metabacillus sediminilitoris TaxID=2567941 RepID=A0A4S4BY74_9BACI|nr:fatty acid--CoA ligase family protein [Metabacillus sediminilitoris]QGQ44576.1 long-chain-fatty-acid--CoA ligase [Metabacillus sediminilitoris]THF80203.1 fatty acid--CoA ligase family protein [Metabacillus sediminilitoris]